MRYLVPSGVRRHHRDPPFFTTPEGGVVVTDEGLAALWVEPEVAARGRPAWNEIVVGAHEPALKGLREHLYARPVDEYGVVAVLNDEYRYFCRDCRQPRS